MSTRRPRFIAEQSARARGLLGRVVAFVMARETWAENQRAIRGLAIRETDHVLDLGCGPGRSLPLLALLAPKGRVVGVDPSPLMAAIASRRSRNLIKAGRVEVATAPAEQLPFAEGAFDKALCVHVLYFWKDLARPLRELARVLKRGGRLVLVFRTGADQAAVAAFPAEIYRFPTLAEVVAALQLAGFAVDGAPDEERPGPILLLAHRV